LGICPGLGFRVRNQVDNSMSIVVGFVT
jgi:hypothetical protein